MFNIKEKTSFVEIAVPIVFVLVIAMMIISIGMIAGNESNRITEGIIVDKRIMSGQSYVSTANGGKNFHYGAHDTTYNFCLSGNKNGKDVTYWVTVSEEDYSQYKVGDYYNL